MTTAVFVHGTGVRRSRFDALFALVSVGFSKATPGLAVTPCYWGDDHGSRLYAGGVTIPSGLSHRDLPSDDLGFVAEPDQDVVAWAVLERDGLFELRLIGLRADREGWSGPPGAEPPGDVIASTLRQAARAPDLADLLTACGLRVDEFRQAVEDVITSEPFEVATAGEVDAGVKTAVVRAVVARTLARADDRIDGALPITGQLRDRILTYCQALLGSDRGLGSSVVRAGLRLGLSLGATRPIERRRLAITEAASPASGDVLRYLARGAGIREAIRAAVAGATPPVVLVGHSLGGIACVDLLAAGSLPEVALLVTVGSQAPLLYELGALPSLSFGEPLPEAFPSWLNVYDHRDLLSFLAAPVFPHAVDHGLDNRVPFPRSHSAYFANDAFYRRVAEVLP